MSQAFTDPQIDRTLNSVAPDVASIIGDLPPPPPPVQPSPYSMSGKEAKAAERMLDRSADQFAAGRVNKTLLRKFGHIAQTIPGAERIRLRKRRENGNLGYIGEYNFRDLASVGDMEVFIAKYAKPTYGPGEYDVTIIDQTGREFPGGSVWIEGGPIDAIGAAPNGGMVDLVRDLVNKNNVPQPLAPDPFEQMRKAQQLAKELKDSAGGDPMAMMIAMQAMTPRASGPDPIVLSALERIAAKLEAPPAVPAMSPLPPPAPEKSLDWIALGSSVVLPLLQMFQASQQAQAQMQMQMAQENTRTMMALMSNKDGLSTKDLLALMNEQHNRSLELLQRKAEEGRPQNTIEDQMEAMVKMKEFAQAFAPAAPPGPQGASFWDALVALASSQDMAGALADRIRQRDASRALPERTTAQVIQFPRQQQQNPAPAGVMTQGVQGTQGAQGAPQGPAQIPLPATLKDDAAKIAMAGDTASRVQATVETLVGLQKDPLFSKFVMALLETTAKNETEKALHGLGRWLSMLVENGLLTRESALAVLKDFKDHWDTIRDLLIERIPMLKAIANTVPATAAPAAPATAAPAPATAAAAPAADPSVPSEIPEGYGEVTEERAEPSIA